SWSGRAPLPGTLMQPLQGTRRDAHPRGCVRHHSFLGKLPVHCRCDSSRRRPGRRGGTSMARWFERANEVSFKPTTQGHVFQAPSPWIFARPRYYVVTEAQKARLLAGLSRWRLILLIASLFNLALIGCLALLTNLSPAMVGRLITPLFRSLGPG